MRELTCIVCPIGCTLSAEEDLAGDPSALKVSGNRCPRGAVYAQEEIYNPRRVVTATCGIALPAGGTDPHRSLTSARRLPVKTSLPCPKEKIDELLNDIYGLKAKLPVMAGEKLISNWKGLGFDVIAVRSLE